MKARKSISKKCIAVVLDSADVTSALKIECLWPFASVPLFCIEGALGAVGRPVLVYIVIHCYFEPSTIQLPTGHHQTFPRQGN